MEQILTNKINIRLLREDIKEYEDALKDVKDLNKVEISENKTFYYKDYFATEPTWVQKFFINALSGHDFSNKSSGGLLLITKKHKGKTRIFAVTFGQGYHLLQLGVAEERFGLRVALNSIEKAAFRKIEKKSMESSPKNLSEQLSKYGEVTNFGINFEQDLITSITAKSKLESLGVTLTGKEALSISTKVDISSIDPLLQKCLEQFEKVDYQENFAWIDHIEEIKNPKTIRSLNQQLSEKLTKKDFDDIWMAVPEIIEWSDVKGFAFDKSDLDSPHEDIHLEKFVKYVSFIESDFEANISLLKKKEILCLSLENDSILKKWKVFHCLYCEITDDSSMFLLSNGKWYQVEQDFVKQIDSFYDSLLKNNVQLPHYNHDNEAEYNLDCAKQLTNTFLMDKKLIHHGSRYSSIEFCDLVTINKQLIHVKRYSGSSTLSHLFNQGYVSAELLCGDQEFRSKLKSILPENVPIELDSKPDTSEIEIIFAIISSKIKNFDLPFFSKISLKNICIKLTQILGYKVSLSIIENKSD